MQGNKKEKQPAMKDLWIFIALGLNSMLLLMLLVFALGVGAEQRVFMLLVATAPASALMALGSWRRPKSA
jgi:hypothetical protein